MLFFLVLLAIAGARAQSDFVCDGPNEFLNTCYSDCETTCATRFRDDRICPTVCGIGCSCIEGYLRNDDGLCVLIGECSPPVCNSDEVYNDCGTRCEANCENFPNPIFCDKRCAPGCFCKEGTVRETPTSLKCVATSSCPPISSK